MNDPRKARRGGFANQRGGFAVGLIIGLLIGLALALGVALYVTKVPVPFVNKVPQRTPSQDAAEAEKNKNWDPNSPLYGKNPARPNAVAPASAPGPVIPGMPSTTPPSANPTNSDAVPAPATSRASGASTRDPAAILADRPPRPASGASGASAAPDAFAYFVQAGAYSKTEDAEAQRAKLAMLGLEGKVTEREQSGRTVYRVRVGPFDKKPGADAVKEKLDGAGIEAALVRVQR